MQRLRHSAPHALGIRVVAWLQAQHFQAQRLQTVRASRGARGQHQIGLECHDALDVGIQTTPHTRHGFHRFGPIGIPIETHQFVALLQGAHGLRQGRQQADDALRGFWNVQTLSAIVQHCDCPRGLKAGQKHKRHKDQALATDWEIGAPTLSHAGLPTG